MSEVIVEGRRGERHARRNPATPKGRQVDETALADVHALLGPLPIRRDLLIEALHLIQDGTGCLRARHLAALAEIFRLSQADVHAVASFYHHFEIVADDDVPPPVTIRICDGLPCQMAGAAALTEAVTARADPARLRVVTVPCIGRCDTAPAAHVGHRAVDRASAEWLFNVASGPLAARVPDYESLSAYRDAGGYQTLARVLSGEISREDAIAAMSDSKLRGLGGAGFPAGKKWGFVRGYPGPRLMTINGDEGEPGTFKDRYWLERHPHRMLEGALIAAHVVEAERIYLYMRDEYQAVLQILRSEIAALQSAGLSRHAPIELRRGAGAYICGEESAMIESIEGKRGLPRHRPPYIAEVGLFGRPTLNHNIETLLWVPTILSDGAEAFAAKGWDENHAGLRSYSVSGRVAEPGVKLAPAGIPVIRLIEDYCGGMAPGQRLKAFLPGGASGGILPASMADLPLDFGTFERHGGFVGSHALIVLSDQDSIHDAAVNLMRFFRHESCGQCTPCRSGTDKMVRMLEAGDLDRDLAEELMVVMRDSSICGLGQAASNSVAHLLRHFPEDVL
ncbi:NADH-ubiquinone oxidoreductase-F iron-sulfur binding region domain-containing protein [Acuticoccus sp. MNP-M23]|uniref:NADH-ubiquinone oxidoreductase-F iron-sulfur binding region domain-containing protein n=1 Tax=Acuticoccus sp. MNP-M23 TaxID=3072793 RepID=UPI0028169A5B|nr:NADH-ubiquinone oxidoreductase-F iron-sulfur binding region domain-containing protein [Acuticoccus sp. MNP-M23]WMS42351.1 NADH-ubiquinone oxidoreductase-F iron-sulfur binding region domain-containing protein [Acuticoccus sp. MNP-M23]